MSRDVLASSYRAPYRRLQVERAEGCRFVLADGRTVIDAQGMAATAILGYGDERVDGAIRAALEGPHQLLAPLLPSVEALALAEQLVSVTPGSHPKRVWYGTSGGGAIDALVWRLVAFDDRPKIVAFDGAHHGVTGLARALTRDRPGGAAALNVLHAPYPYPLRCRWGPCDPEACSLSCLDFLEQRIVRAREHRGRIAAVVIEPVQSPSGEIVPPGNYLPALRSLCEEQGIWLVADEVKTGLGRTGRFLACEHDGVVPDAVVLGKGLGGGLPLSAVVARKELLDGPFAAETLSGNRAACAAALATLAAIAEDGLLERAGELGSWLRSRLGEATRGHQLVGEVRGRGLMIGIELVRGDREPAAEAAQTCGDYCFDAGLLVRVGGLHGNVVSLTPPLVLAETDAREIVDILVAALERVGRPR